MLVSRSIVCNCFKSEMEETPLSRREKLYEYMIVRYDPPGFRMLYPVGYVDLPEERDSFFDRP